MITLKMKLAHVDEALPVREGTYIVMNKYGNISEMMYTVECGWNTSRDPDGTIDPSTALNDGYVIGWLKEPDLVTCEKILTKLRANMYKNGGVTIEC